jgi:hypothetical protein
MGLFDLFSGKSGRLAAMATAQQLGNTQNQITGLLNQGKTEGIGYLDAAQPLSLAALGQGYDAAKSAYGQASDMFSPYAQTGQAGFNMYANAAGLNGPAGNATATAAFQASPGYDWLKSQTLEGAARKLNAGGAGTVGGNVLTALEDRAGQIANQEYGGWLSRLRDIGQTGYGATTAQAGLEKGVGDLGFRYGGDQASIYDATARAKAGVAGNTMALGANSLLNLGNLNAQNTTAGLLAGQAGNKNSLDALLAVLGLGTKVGAAYYGAPTAKVA